MLFPDRSTLQRQALIFVACLAAAAPRALLPVALPLQPEAAVAAFAVLAWGSEALPAIVAAAALAALGFAHAPPAAALLLAAAQGLGPLLGRAALGRAALRRLWRTPHSVARFLLTMVLLDGIVLAVGNAAAAAWAHAAAPHPLAQATAAMCAVAMLTPALHGVWRYGLPRRARGEGAAVLLATVALGAALLLTPGIESAVRGGLLTLLLVPVLWAIFRLDATFVALAVALVYPLVLGALIAGYGPNADAPRELALLGAQLRGIALASAALLAGALQARRLRAAAALRALNAELERRVHQRAEQLAHQQRDFREVLHKLPTPALLCAAADSALVYANPAAQALFVAPRGASLHELAAWDDTDAVDALLGGSTSELHDELSLRRADGSVLQLAVAATRTTFDGAAACLLSFDDVTARHRREQVLRQQAGTDALTATANRYALDEHLPQALERARRTATTVAVGVLDLDDFKQVNDTWGHAVGDQLLVAFAARLRRALGGHDLLARLGGDEFVVVFEGLDGAEPQAQLEAALQRLHEATAGGVELPGGTRVDLALSMGVALFPQHAQLPGELLRQADVAMYQAKRRKHTGVWWQWHAADPAQPGEEDAIDAYGADARALLERHAGDRAALRSAFVAALEREMDSDAQAAALLTHIEPAVRLRLCARQAAHLERLCAPQATHERVVARARRTGRRLALAGIDTVLQLRAHALYRHRLVDTLNRALLGAQQRYRLLQVIETRLQDDLQTQVQAAQEVQAAYAALLAAPLPAPGSLWPDASAQALASLGTLPGVQAALLMRAGSSGVLTPEASFGPRAREVAAALGRAGDEPRVDATGALGSGAEARAWRSLQTHSTVALARDAAHPPWRAAAAALTLGSALAVPIRDAMGQAVAVLLLYGAQAGQFEAAAMQLFAHHLRQHWEEIWLRCASAAPVVAEEQARELRSLLFAGGLAMYVQPVVDLRDGTLAKVEALARMIRPDGRVIGPGAFLPLLGEADLSLLFRTGLRLALQQLARWDADGVHVDVAVNLPPRTMLDAQCPQWIVDALREHGIEPQRLTLELLEHQSLDPAAQDAAVARLAPLGVQLSMDDLGSGYSSLQRLAALPFTSIKADQGLLVRLREQPLQTLSMLRTIIQMGADLERGVVVEGLEDDDMVEAARWLGAPYGQGYALARPMPADALIPWWRERGGRLLPTDTTPRSALGALAWKWTRRDAPATALADCPLHGFLQQRLPHDAAIHRCHARLHAGDADARRELVERLAARVQAAAAERTLSAD